MPIKVKPLEPFGAEVSMDLRDMRNAEPFRDIFQRHGLLVFREQTLNPEEQANVMRILGPILDHWSGTGYVSNVHPGGILGDIKLSFHQDFSQTSYPTLALSLLAVDVENDATSTLFASGERAYITMPDELRHELRHRQVHNVWMHDQETREGRSRHDHEVGIDYPGAVHNVFVVDPLTGRHTLIAGPMASERIIGVSREHSDRLLDQLFEILYAPDNIYEHHWKMGDLVIWSNLAFCHARSAIASSRPRTLQRVCIGHGTQAYYEPPESFALGQYRNETKQTESIMESQPG